MICVKDKLPSYNEEEDFKDYWGFYLESKIDNYDNIEDVALQYGVVTYYGNNTWKDNNWHNVTVLYWEEIPTVPNNYINLLQELFNDRHNNYTIIKIEDEFYYSDLQNCNKYYPATLNPILGYDDDYDSIGSIVLNEQGLPCKVVEQDSNIILQELEYITHKEYLKLIDK